MINRETYWHSITCYSNGDIECVLKGSRDAFLRQRWQPHSDKYNRLRMMIAMEAPDYVIDDFITPPARREILCAEFIQQRAKLIKEGRY
jgi:hypothetical protein